MTLPLSGAISLNSVNLELSKPSASTVSLNDTNVRTLLQLASGPISLANAYGKSAGVSSTNTMVVGVNGNNNFFGYDTGMMSGFVIGSMTPNTVSLRGIPTVIESFAFNAYDGIVFLLLDWNYTTPGNLFVTYNSVKYTFVQDYGVGAFFVGPLSLSGLFATGQSRSIAITTS